MVLLWIVIIVIIVILIIIIIAFAVANGSKNQEKCERPPKFAKFAGFSTASGLTDPVVEQKVVAAPPNFTPVIAQKTHGGGCSSNEECSAEFICNSRGICDYPDGNQNTCPRGTCSQGHSCVEGICQPNSGMLCNEVAKCSNGICRLDRTIFKLVSTPTGRHWEKLIDVPAVSPLELHANMTQAGPEFYLLTSDQGIMYYNPGSQTWTTAIALTTTQTVGGQTVQLTPRTMSVSNSGGNRGSVIAAFSVREGGELQPYSLFMNVVFNTTMGRYVLTPRNTYDDSSLNGQIFSHQPPVDLPRSLRPPSPDPEMSPISALKISLSGDIVSDGLFRLTIYGTAVFQDEELRDQFYIFKLRQTDSNGFYESAVSEEPPVVGTKPVTIINNYTGDPTQPFNDRYLNFAYTISPIEFGQSDYVAYKGQQSSAPRVPIFPPGNFGEIIDTDLWSRLPSENLTIQTVTL